MVSLNENTIANVHVNKMELQLTEDEQARLLHQQMHEKHKGHEAMHLEMLIILILGVALSQIALIEWRRRYFRSYQIVTLIGMWLIPVCFCTFQGWWRFVIIWLLFSVANYLVVRKATRQSIDGATPRLVYKWFYLVYKVSYIMGFLGYLLLLFTMVGFNMLFHLKAQECMRVSILGLFYGLYFGVLGRDLAEICTDMVAARVGYYTSTGMPLRHLEANMCAVCGNSIHNHEVTIQEKSYQLGCGHIFHEFCIRGWCIVGKKQTCPYCKEKVDLKQMISNPWERRPHVMYGHLLDWIRYMVAWQPLVLTAVQTVIYMLGLE